MSLAIAHLAAAQDAFDGRAAARWFRAHAHVPFIAGAAYAALLVAVPRIMAARKPLRLRVLTVAWNFALAAFSILGAVHTLPMLTRVLSEGGFKYSCCADVYEMVGGRGYGAPYLWASLFVVSKIVEFGDTVILMCKKKPVVFLHAFHHVSVAVLAWVGFAAEAPVAMWCGTMNYVAHSVMYSYYTAMGLPRLRAAAAPLAGAVTLLQIAQMVMATVIHVAILAWRLVGATCWWDPPMLLCTLGLYVVYLCLFAQVFVSRYVRGDRARGKRPGGKAA